jgi:outer membrane protein, heavy metal efflux system
MTRKFWLSLLFVLPAAAQTLQLSDFEHWALENSPLLKQANALVQGSQGRARQAGLLPNPSIGYQGEQIRGGSYRGGEEGGYVEQTFILGGKLGLRREASRQQAKSDEAAIPDQRNRVLGETGRSFYSALTAQETVKLRQDLLSLAGDAMETARQLANVGQADAPDVLEAEVEAEQAKSDYATAQQAFTHAFAFLASVAGKPDLPAQVLAGDLENLPTLDETALLAHMMKDNPAVARARQEALQAEADLKSARREVIPDLTLRAGLQQNNEPLNQVGASVGVQGFASAGITLPIFNRNQGNIQAARADLERATSEIDRVQRELRQSALPLLQSYAASRGQAERYKNEMIPRAAKAYQLYLAKYQAMGAPYASVLTAQRTLFQLRVNYLRTLAELWTSVVTLQNLTLMDAR